MLPLITYLVIIITWSLSYGAILQVGPTRQYQTPQSAMTAAHDGDTLEIDPVLYTGQANTNLLIDKNVTIRGVNGRPRFDCQDTGVFSIGCWVVHTNVTQVSIENVEIFNFKTPASASCIRVNTPGRFTLRNSYLHDCQQLLLSSNQGTQSFWIENNLFTAGGRAGAQEHNVYIGESAELVFIRNRSWNSTGGQTVKTRSRKTSIVHNVIGDLEAKFPASNIELDISCGGEALVANNQFYQARNSSNQAIISFGPEACQTGPQKLSVVANVFVNEASGSSPTAMRVRRQAAVTTFALIIEDNILIGPGVLFEDFDNNLDPDLSTNVERSLPEPPVAYVGPPEQVRHSLVSGGVVLSWIAAPGATGAVLRKGTTIIPGTSTTATDTGPFTAGSTITYEVRSLQGASESQPAFYTVVMPLPLPSNPTPQAFTTGWYEAPNSRYHQVYAAPVDHRTRYLVEAWSGAGYDPASNSLLLFGGGLPDYAGNELVRVPFHGPPTIAIPASTNLGITTISNPVEALLDGKPAWRHSYGGLAYAQERQTLYVFGGQVPRSVPSNGLWAVDMSCACGSALQWTRLAYTGDIPESTYGSILAWNPTDGHLWIKTTSHLYSYNPSTNVMTKRNTAAHITGIYHNGIIDVARQTLVISNGANITEIALTNPFNVSTIKTFLPEESFGGWPGMAYDSSGQRVVMWNGGARFGVVTAGVYQEKQVQGGPGGAVPTGTHGRFVYIPQWQTFGIQNLATQNLWVVRVD